ncbi:MAG: TIGR01458 family HAD-type hydrolase [Hyphomicrobiales bacterium]|nr:TIGR01458 family HAD-type hydrolase [Hyphomicrobiales bacterium]
MISGALIDLAGVVYLGTRAVPGAVEAIERLRAADVPIRFVTNTTRMAKAGVLERLSAMGLGVDPPDLFTPAAAARAWLTANRRSPHLLIHPALVEDFEGLGAYPDEAIVVGDAGVGFTYDSLNAAFRALMSGAAFLALAKNRYFLDRDGVLSLDAGGFVAALEFASGQQAVILGKPAPDFYAAVVASLGRTGAETVMVGDDIEADVSGALRAGIGAALLVRTGKYQPGAEDGRRPAPTAVVDDIVAAVDWILDHRAVNR